MTACPFFIFGLVANKAANPRDVYDYLNALGWLTPCAVKYDFSVFNYYFFIPYEAVLWMLL